MTKRFCDRCGKEVGVFKDIEFQTWWTITRHGMMDLTTELCDACYQAKFVADTPQTDIVFYDYEPGTDNVRHLGWSSGIKTDCGWKRGEDNEANEY